MFAHLQHTHKTVLWILGLSVFMLGTVPFAQASAPAGLWFEWNIPAAVGESSTVQVRLVDTDGNPLVGEYYLVSSQNQVFAATQSQLRSDTTGSFTLDIQRQKAGALCLAVVHPLSQQTIASRCFEQPKKSLWSYLLGDSVTPNTVVPVSTFVAATPQVLGSSSDMWSIEKARESLASFALTGLPSRVMVGEPFSLTVAATDVSGSVLAAFSGAIRFESDDTTAQLPLNYTLVPDKDKGQHAFPLGFIFRKEGTYTLTVSDVLKPSAKGTLRITVQKKETASTTTASLDRPVILLPTEGMSLSESYIDVYGKQVPAAAEVLIYDKNAKIATVTADAKGEFRTRLTDVAEGEHTLTVVAFDAKGAPTEVSAPVNVMIDHSLPTLKDTIVTPRDIVSGQDIEVSFTTTSDVEKARLQIDGVWYDMQKDTKKLDRWKFQGRLVADTGLYSLLAELTDVKKRVSTMTVPAKIQILEKIASPQTPATPVETTGPKVDTFTYAPTAVTLARAALSVADKSRVQLSWTAATDDEQVSFYRIYYGTERDVFPFTAQTHDARTAWYITGLAPATTYHFKIVAVDNRGNEWRTLAGSYTQIQTLRPTPGVDVPFEYHVQKGDTVVSIARQYQVSQTQLAKMNSITTGTPLVEGMILKIPLEKTTQPIKPLKMTQTGAASDVLVLAFLFVLSLMWTVWYRVIRRIS